MQHYTIIHHRYIVIYEVFVIITIYWLPAPPPPRLVQQVLAEQELAEQELLLEIALIDYIF